MALRHRELPIEGVQFHPESVLTEGGHLMLANWLAACGLAPDPALVEAASAAVRRLVGAPPDGAASHGRRGPLPDREEPSSLRSCAVRPSATGVAAASWPGEFGSVAGVGVGVPSAASGRRLSRTISVARRRPRVPGRPARCRRTGALRRRRRRSGAAGRRSGPALRARPSVSEPASRGLAPRSGPPRRRAARPCRSETCSVIGGARGGLRALRRGDGDDRALLLAGSRPRSGVDAGEAGLARGCSAPRSSSRPDHVGHGDRCRARRRRPGRPSVPSSTCAPAAGRAADDQALRRRSALASLGHRRRPRARRR